ncbi:MAG TPA: YraN family protein [Candidatus Krumholzibacteria bacterium]|jgi:putative endonuclease|nr:YraN family protein [Candidatus Krumholzibacteria bacterium]
MLSPGRQGEEIAACYLELQGCAVLQRNVRHAEVEIDLLGREGRCLVLVEVKLRTDGLVPARDALSRRQEQRLLRAAQALLARHPWAEQVRIDLIAIDHERRAGRLQLEHWRGVLPRSW